MRIVAAASESWMRVESAAARRIRPMVTPMAIRKASVKPATWSAGIGVKPRGNAAGIVESSTVDTTATPVALPSCLCVE